MAPASPAAASGGVAVTAAAAAAAEDGAGPASPSAAQRQEGYYNPRPQSPLLARVVIMSAAADGAGPQDAAGDATPLVRTRIEAADVEAGASSLSSVATLCNSAVGAGVLALPFAFRCAGLLGGLALCVFVGAAESVALFVLSKFAERYDAHSYGSLVRRALGRKLASALSAIMLLYLFGSCVAYLVIVGDTFSSLAGQAWPDAGAALTGRQPVLLAIGGVVILPMCFAQSLSALELASVGAVIGFLYTSAAILWRGTQVVLARADPWAGVLLWQPRLREALYAVSILVFGFNSSANTISIFSELDSFPHRLVVLLPPSPRGYAHRLGPRVTTYKMIGMLGVIIVAMGLIAAGYVVVGVAGYMAFPSSVPSNILNAFPPDDRLMQIARGVIGAMVTLHYPVNFSPARLAFTDLLDSLCGVHSVGRAAVTAFTLLFFAATMGVAMVVSDLGEVLHLIGGTAATFMIFLLPGLLCWNAASIKATASALNLADHGAAAPSPGPGSVTSPGPATPTVGGGPSSPLLLADKKAGLRRTGLVFLPTKSWWLGFVLIALAVAVFAITLATTGGTGGGH